MKFIIFSHKIELTELLPIKFLTRHKKKIKGKSFELILKYIGG